MKRFLFISFLLISFTVSAEHAYQTPRSSVLEVTDHNTKLKYSLSIKLPRSYSNKPNRTYPVIYLLDAPYAFQLASGATRFPMNSAKMDEAILVGIGYSHDLYPNHLKMRVSVGIKSGLGKALIASNSGSIGKINNAV